MKYRKKPVIIDGGTKMYKVIAWKSLPEPYKED